MKNQKLSLDAQSHHSYSTQHWKYFPLRQEKEIKGILTGKEKNCHCFVMAFYTQKILQTPKKFRNNK